MNQPSAGTLFEIMKDCENTGLFIATLLDRYHLLDKTEPVAGAVIFDQFDEFFETYGCKATHESFDIYPKGTVARLEGKIKEVKGTGKEWGHLSKEEMWNVIQEIRKVTKDDGTMGGPVEVVKKLQAEVDRLKGVVSSLEIDKQYLQGYIEQETKKPEAGDE